MLLSGSIAFFAFSWHSIKSSADKTQKGRINAGLLALTALAFTPRILVLRGSWEMKGHREILIGFENALIAKLIDKVEDPIPHCMFEQRADALMETFANQLKSQHVDMDLYLQYTGMTQDELKATYLDRAENEVKLRLALEKIAELEALEVSEEEMDAELTKLAEGNNMTLEDVKARIPMQEYKTDMLVTKALDLIKESAIVDNTVAEEAATEEVAAE